jgi:hypothetical protein
MDWFRQNPLLGGLLAVTALLALVGGYFAQTASAFYTEQSEAYTTHTGTLSRLQAAKPFPSEVNRAAAQAELDAAEKTLQELSSYVESQSDPVRPLNPQEFQDELSKKVAAMVEAAAKSGVALPEDFYLGFDAYRTTPPPPAAAALLGQQLLAVEQVVTQLIKARVNAISGISRRPLPVEAAAGDATKNNKDKPPEGGASKLAHLSLAPFDVAFTGDQSASRAAMGAIVTARPLIFIRLAAVANSQPVAPSKEAPAEAAAPAAEGQKASGIPVLFGQETLQIMLRLAAISGPENK